MPKRPRRFLPLLVLGTVAVLAALGWSLFRPPPPTSPPRRWLWTAPTPEDTTAPRLQLAWIDPSTVAFSIRTSAADGQWISRIVALDATTGQERWRWETAPESKYYMSIATLYPLHDGSVVVSLNGQTGPARRAPDAVRLDSATGREVWRWTGSPGNPRMQRHLRALTAGEEFLMLDILDWEPNRPHSPRVVSLNPRTGAQRWERSVEGGEKSETRIVSAALLLDGDVLLTWGLRTPPVSDNRTLARWSGQTGQTVWESVLPSVEGARAEWSMITLGLQGELFTTVKWTKAGAEPRGEAMRWAPGDGRLLWRRNAPIAPIDLPFMYGGRCLIAAPAGDLRVLTTESREERRFSFRAWLSNLSNPKAAQLDEIVPTATLHTLRASDGVELPMRPLGDIREVDGGFLGAHSLADGSLVLSNSVESPGKGHSLLILQWPAETLIPGGRGAPVRRELLTPHAQPGWSPLLSPDGRTVVASGLSEDGANWWVAAW